MQTSFDAPRVASNNPFASYDPLSPPASSATAKPGLDASYFGAASSLYFDEPSGDPWSTSPTASTSTSTATAGGGIGARTSAYSTRSNDASNDTYSVFEAVVDDASLPPIYEQAFRAAVAYSSSNASTISTSLGTGGGTAARGGSVSLSTLHKVLSSCARLPASEVERIINIVTTAGGGPSAATTPQASPYRSQHPHPRSSRLGRTEFIVAIALAGLWQEKKPLSIKALSARRSFPPKPNLDLTALQVQPNGHQPGTQRSPHKAQQDPEDTTIPSSPTRRSYKVSSASSTDPWVAGPNSSGKPVSSANTGRQDSLLTSNDGQQYTASQDTYTNFPAYEESPFSGSSPYDAGPSSIRGSGDTQGLPPFPGSLAASKEAEDIYVHQSPTLAGSWINRYTVYMVTTRSKASRMNASLADSHHLVGVERRYSDWLWLHECLSKKYPARMLLTVPPKRVGISARHIQLSSTASEEQFLERRRKGLARYLTFAANHPVLRKERLIHVFLNERLDLATWRKNNPDLDLDDESYALRLNPTQESLIPVSLSAQLKNMTAVLPPMIDALTRFCALLERIQHRHSANASDLLRAKMSLDTFNEVFMSTSQTGSATPSQYNSHEQHAHASASLQRGGFGRSKEVQEELTILSSLALPNFTSSLTSLSEMTDFYHSETFEGEVLEKYKGQREMWRALYELVQRYETKLKPDNVDKLKKKIEGAQGRYQSISQSSSAATPQNQEELKKILESIERDQDAIKIALDRRVALRWCVAQELRYAWRSSANMRVILSDWSREESSFQQRVASLWQSLDDALSLSE